MKFVLNNLMSMTVFECPLPPDSLGVETKVRRYPCDRKALLRSKHASNK